MLFHVIQRVKKSKLIEDIVVATTKKKEDLEIVKIAKKCGVRDFRGSEDDVLDRFYQAAKVAKAESIVRITADCPLIDPVVVDKVIEHFLSGCYDYASNTLKRTYPDGLDTEVFTYKVLERAWKNAKWASEREHVTPYIIKHPEMFRLGNVENEKDLSYMRWCVDTERDLKFVRAVYRHLYKKKKVFLMDDILKLLERRPEIMAINKGIPTNEGYLKSLREDRIVR